VLLSTPRGLELWKLCPSLSCGLSLSIAATRPATALSHHLARRHYVAARRAIWCYGLKVVGVFFERQRHPSNGTCTAATSDEYINEHSRHLERFSLLRGGPDCRVEMPITSRTVSRRAQLALRFLSRQPKALPVFLGTRSPPDSTLSFGFASHSVMASG
jgi:hypothetical protein